MGVGLIYLSSDLNSLYSAAHFGDSSRTVTCIGNPLDDLRDTFPLFVAHMLTYLAPDVSQDLVVVFKIARVL